MTTEDDFTTIAMTTAAEADDLELSTSHSTSAESKSDLVQNMKFISGIK